MAKTKKVMTRSTHHAMLLEAKRRREEERELRREADRELVRANIAHTKEHYPEAMTVDESVYTDEYIDTMMDGWDKSERGVRMLRVQRLIKEYGDTPPSPPPRDLIEDVMNRRAAEDIAREIRAQQQLQATLRDEAFRPVGPSDIDWDELDPEWVIPQVALRGEVTSIVAAGGVGKTLLMRDIAFGLTSYARTTPNHPDFGPRVRVLGMPGTLERVLYIDRENTTAQFARTLRTLGAGPGMMSTEQLEFTLERYRHYDSVAWPPFTARAGGELVRDLVVEHSSSVVIIDTVSKCLGEMSENDAATFMALYENFLQPLKELGVTVILLDHVKKDGASQRGSSAKHDNVDMQWMLTRCEHGLPGGMGARVEGGGWDGYDPLPASAGPVFRLSSRVDEGGKNRSGLAQDVLYIQRRGRIGPSLELLRDRVPAEGTHCFTPDRTSPWLVEPGPDDPDGKRSRMVDHGPGSGLGTYTGPAPDVDFRHAWFTGWGLPRPVPAQAPDEHGMILGPVEPLEHVILEPEEAAAVESANETGEAAVAWAMGTGGAGGRAGRGPGGRGGAGSRGTARAADGDVDGDDAVGRGRKRPADAEALWDRLRAYVHDTGDAGPWRKSVIFELVGVARSSKTQSTVTEMLESRVASGRLREIRHGGSDGSPWKLEYEWVEPDATS